MSDENNEAENAAPPKVDAGTSAAAPADSGKAPSMLDNLKSNPKVLYVAGGAAVLVALLLALGGGGGGESAKMLGKVSPGQAVTLSNPNGGEVQLNALPTLVSVAQTEEDEKQIVCRVASGTPATVVDEQASGLLSFVRVKVNEGSCQGSTGWTAKINVK